MISKTFLKKVLLLAVSITLLTTHTGMGIDTTGLPDPKNLPKPGTGGDAHEGDETPMGKSVNELTGSLRGFIKAFTNLSEELQETHDELSGKEKHIIDIIDKMQKDGIPNNEIVDFIKQENKVDEALAYQFKPGDLDQIVRLGPIINMLKKQQQTTTTTTHIGSEGEEETKPEPVQEPTKAPEVILENIVNVDLKILNIVTPQKRRQKEAESGILTAIGSRRTKMGFGLKKETDLEELRAQAISMLNEGVDGIKNYRKEKDGSIDYNKLTKGPLSKITKKLLEENLELDDKKIKSPDELKISFDEKSKKLESMTQSESLTIPQSLLEKEKNTRYKDFLEKEYKKNIKKDLGHEKSIIEKIEEEIKKQKNYVQGEIRRIINLSIKDQKDEFYYIYEQQKISLMRALENRKDLLNILVKSMENGLLSEIVQKEVITVEQNRIEKIDEDINSILARQLLVYITENKKLTEDVEKSYLNKKETWDSSWRALLEKCIILGKKVALTQEILTKITALFGYKDAEKLLPYSSEQKEKPKALEKSEEDEIDAEAKRLIVDAGNDLGKLQETLKEQIERDDLIPYLHNKIVIEIFGKVNELEKEDTIKKLNESYSKDKTNDKISYELNYKFNNKKELTTTKKTEIKNINTLFNSIINELDNTYHSLGNFLLIKGISDQGFYEKKLSQIKNLETIIRALKVTIYSYNLNNRLLESKRNYDTNELKEFFYEKKEFPTPQENENKCAAAILSSRDIIQNFFKLKKVMYEMRKIQKHIVTILNTYWLNNLLNQVYEKFKIKELNDGLNKIFEKMITKEVLEDESKKNLNKILEQSIKKLKEKTTLDKNTTKVLEAIKYGIYHTFLKMRKLSRLAAIVKGKIDDPNIQKKDDAITWWKGKQQTKHHLKMMYQDLLKKGLLFSHMSEVVKKKYEKAPLETLKAHLPHMYLLEIIKKQDEKKPLETINIQKEPLTISPPLVAQERAFDLWGFLNKKRKDIDKLLQEKETFGFDEKMKLLREMLDVAQEKKEFLNKEIEILGELCKPFEGEIDDEDIEEEDEEALVNSGFLLSVVLGGFLPDPSEILFNIKETTPTLVKMFDNHLTTLENNFHIESKEVIKLEVKKKFAKPADLEALNNKIEEEKQKASNSKDSRSQKAIQDKTGKADQLLTRISQAKDLLKDPAKLTEAEEAIKKLRIDVILFKLEIGASEIKIKAIFNKLDTKVKELEKEFKEALEKQTDEISKKEAAEKEQRDKGKKVEPVEEEPAEEVLSEEDKEKLERELQNLTEDAGKDKEEFDKATEMQKQIFVQTYEKKIKNTYKKRALEIAKHLDVSALNDAIGKLEESINQFKKKKTPGKRKKKAPAAPGKKKDTKEEEQLEDVIEETVEEEIADLPPTEEGEKEEKITTELQEFEEEEKEEDLPEEEKEDKKISILQKMETMSRQYLRWTKEFEEDDMQTKTLKAISGKHMKDLRKVFNELKSEISTAQLDQDEEITPQKNELANQLKTLAKKDIMQTMSQMEKLYSLLTGTIESGTTLQQAGSPINSLKQEFKNLGGKISAATLQKDMQIIKKKRQLAAQLETLAEKDIMQDINKAFKGIKGKNLHEKANNLFKDMKSTKTQKTKRTIKNLQKIILLEKLFLHLQEKMERIKRKIPPTTQLTNLNQAITQELKAITSEVDQFRNAQAGHKNVGIKGWGGLTKHINGLIKKLNKTAVSGVNLISKGQLNPNLEQDIVKKVTPKKKKGFGALFGKKKKKGKEGK